MLRNSSSSRWVGNSQPVPPQASDDEASSRCFPYGLGVSGRIFRNKIIEKQSSPYPYGAATKSAIRRHAFQHDRFGADEAKLIMQIHDIVLEAFKIMPLLLMRRDGVARNETN